jgi:hypothetical protein
MIISFLKKVYGFLIKHDFRLLSPILCLLCLQYFLFKLSYVQQLIASLNREALYYDDIVSNILLQVSFLTRLLLLGIFFLIVTALLNRSYSVKQRLLFLLLSATSLTLLPLFRTVII